MSTPLAIVNLGSTGDVPASIKYFSNPKKVGCFIDGLYTGAAVGTPKELASLLLANHHNPRGRRVARTAVISVKTPRRATKAELEDIDERLVRAFWDLQKILKVPMLGWTHHNTATRHLHIIFPNSNGVRCLDLRPKFLRQLQGFMWTMSLLSGRGKGRRKALPCYPKSHKLIVRDVADELLDDHGEIRPDRWKALVAQGKISNFRQRKSGELISFEWGGTGRRVRMATLRGFALERLNLQLAIEKPSYEVDTISTEPGQAPASSGGLGPLTPTHQNDSVLAPKAGPEQRGTVPVALAPEPTALQAAVHLARNWTQHPATDWLHLELLTIIPLAQTHCRLVGWLAQGDASNAGPQLGLPQPPQPPAPSVPPQDSKGPTVPALGFD